MTANFADILNVKADDVKKPDPNPAGTYLASIDSKEFDTSRQKQTPYVRYHATILEIGEDVDPDLLQEYIDNSGGKSPVGKKIRFEFYLTPDSLYRLTDFLRDHVGVDTSGKTLDQLVDEAIGKQVGVVIDHAMTRGNEVVANVSRTFAWGK